MKGILVHEVGAVTLVKKVDHKEAIAKLKFRRLTILAYLMMLEDIDSYERTTKENELMDRLNDELDIVTAKLMVYGVDVYAY